MNDIQVGRIEYLGPVATPGNQIAPPTADVLKINGMIAAARDAGRKEGYRDGWIAARTVIGGAMLQLSSRAAKVTNRQAIRRVYRFIQDIDPPDLP